MVAHGKGGKLYEIPDWRKYKVEDAPELVEIQQRLASKGLKDPWLRNEVWRYVPYRGSRFRNFAEFASRGILYGFIAGVVTIAFTEITGLAVHHDNHGNGHGHGHVEKEEIAEPEK